MCVPENERTPGTDKVHIMAIVRVVQVTTVAAHHKARSAAYASKGTDRGVHSAGHHALRSIEQFCGYRGVGVVQF